MENRIPDSFESFNRDLDDVYKLELNDSSYESKEEMLKELIGLLEESLQEGDIEGNVFDQEAYKRFITANKICLPLFSNPKKIEIECNPHLSFATTTITCESIGFAVHNDARDRKELYLEFMSLIDFMHTSSISFTEINVSFAVNNVFREVYG